MTKGDGETGMKKFAVLLQDVIPLKNGIQWRKSLRHRVLIIADAMSWIPFFNGLTPVIK